MILERGSKGNPVGNLQRDIVFLGFGDLLGKWKIDKHYGTATEKAVKSIQKWLGIKVDGIAGSQTFNAIDKRKKEVGKIRGTRNFSIHEFRCKGTGKMLKNGMDNKLLLKLEELRFQLGNKPITITSGYRTKEHNRNVGGATNSQHLYGKASDIVVKGVPPSTVYRKANQIFSNGGVGKYNTFTHVDTRGYRARF